MSDESERQRAMRRAGELEEERARPVPRPDRVVAVDRQDLADVLAWLSGRPGRTQEMTTSAFWAANRLAVSAGIAFP